MCHTRKRWTSQEIELLKNNYKKGVKELCKLLPNRSKFSMRKKRERLGLEGNFYKLWTMQEKKLLKKLWSVKPIEEIPKFFPKRTKVSIQRMAWLMKIKRNYSASPITPEPIMPNLNEPEKAYIAGFLDGDGCICMFAKVPKNKQHRRSLHYSFTVTIGNTDSEIIQYLFSKFGGSMYKRKKTRKNWRVFQYWRICDRHASAFLKMIYPYLRIKRKQAEIIIKFRNEVRHSGTMLSPEILQKRETYRKQLASLKH